MWSDIITTKTLHEPLKGRSIQRRSPTIGLATKFQNRFLHRPRQRRRRKEVQDVSLETRFHRVAGDERVLIFFQKVRSFESVVGRRAERSISAQQKPSEQLV